MGLLRSEFMELYRLTIPKDDAWRVVESLGNLDLAHFIDLNKNENAFALPYAMRVKLCDETERRIQFLIKKCQDNKIKINKPPSVEAFTKNIATIEQEKKKAMHLLFDAIEQDVMNDEQFVAKQSKTIEEMTQDINKLEDYLQVIQFVTNMVPQLQGARPARVNPSGDAENGLADADQPLIDGSLQFVAGTIKDGETERMRRMLFRATRGQALTHFRTFEQDGVAKVTYLVVFQSMGKSRDRIQRICDSFMGQRFEIPSDISTLDDRAKATQNEITKSRQLLQTSSLQLQQYLYEMNSMNQGDEENISTLEIYMWFVAKEKAIFNVLNMMKSRSSTYIGFMWAPVEKEAAIKEHLANFHTTEFNRWRTGENESHKIMPPTHFKQNDVSFIHQYIVDMYNVPTYQEINPAAFSIVTFPFLFSMMYGDYGHGGFFFLLGLILVFLQPKYEGNPSLHFIFAFRYMVLMMGMFAMYNGLLYNEFFAVPNNWFGSCYKIQGDRKDAAWGAAQTPPVTIGTYELKNPEEWCVYPFGFDPVWWVSSQQLNFTNSVKMKMAVIMATFHMSTGMICKGLNAIYFKKWMVLIFEVFTGLVIFWGLIGWLVFLVFFKWMFYPVNAYSNIITDEAGFKKINMSPSLINVMTSLTVSLGAAPVSLDPITREEVVVEFFPNQTTIGKGLILGVMVAVPLMLCVIPCTACCTHKKDAGQGEEFQQREQNGESEENQLIESGDKGNDADVKADTLAFQELLNGGAGEEHHGLDEIFIHQMIETIEFVLNCISNTASYLRLWALSLAHSELANVFLEQLLGMVWAMQGPTGSVAAITAVTFFVGFAWSAATVFILICMDFVECLLHTQRLHWVEFMSKFYGGGGYAYQPFSFREVFKGQMLRA